MDPTGLPAIPDRKNLVVDPRHLPTPPAIVLQIIRQLSDENIAIEELADSVSLDGALAGSVLRMVNSAAFSPGTRVVRLGQAINMMGLKAFRSIVMGSAMKDLVPDTDSSTAAEIRRRTLVNATLSRAFANELNPLVADEAFLGGLLGSLGHLVFDRKAPEVHAYLRELGGGWPQPRDEVRILGYIIDDVTGDLLSSWSIPDRVYEAIMLRSETRKDWLPRVTDPDLVTALRLGLVAEGVLCGSDDEAGLGDLVELSREVLGLELLALTEILIETKPLVAELARSLKFEVPSDGRYEAVLADAMTTLETAG